MKKVIAFSITLLFASISQAETYKSIATGFWENNSTWDLNQFPDGSKENTITISSGDTVTATNLNVAKATTIIVENGAALIINTLDVNIDAAEARKDFILDVKDGGLLIINGNFTAAKDASLTIDGNATITGDLTLGNNAKITVDSDGTSGGTLNIGGDLTVGTGSELLGYGNVTVAGTVDPLIAGDTQLPIELTHFAATSNENDVTIYWQTASEENNHYFTIERSVDGISFKTIGTVMGAGNSQITLNYSFTDVSPLSGTTYYRLQQTDFDGKFEIFNMVSVSFYNEGTLKVFPNPASSYITIDFGGLTAQSQIQIMNLHGQVVKTLSVWESVQTIDLSDLAAGNYLLTIANGNQPIVKRIVIQ
ncbi:MAG: hypothetical protein CVU09_05290 [Bacteroidetes bacterium HGW-Bacteroidetes-4]|jgi:hypothetical protein|nr:MAG: hypothetical protein CVU09_05290 [Bacteroidetes bacterium HGW-Bacteroidetes-4]